ncbi:MAG: trypsin-like peptidase domain-containing protein [Pirellulaceae bacterium]|nr:trypsin-like peptidase domain-containing protein [Pirellulaceae bacterium]
MASLHALLVMVALTAAPGDPTLLVFHSPQCGPCQSMAPTLERLEQAGYPVRRIDVGQQPHLAQRYGVRAVPSFVMLADGREADRVDGPTSLDRLQQMFARGGRKQRATQPARYRGQSPDDLGSHNPIQGGAADSGAAEPGGQDPAARSGTEDDVARAAQAALHATVRLRVEDEQGQSWGTGTIIDVHGDEALIVTCGHIFRDSNGQGRIQVELFAPGAQGPVPGELIAYDAKDRDIGLVSIRTNLRLQPVRVAPAGSRSLRGDRVFTIGCNHGQDPTIVHSHVTAVNKYLGPANIEVAGQPVDGRSGGGLFTANGQLIGVCNAADPQDKEGIYAALDTIHRQLADVGQSRLFEVAATGPTPENSRPAAHEPQRALTELAAVGNGPPVNGNRLDNEDTEVICILRRRDQQPQQVILLDRLPPHLLQQLMEAAGQQSPASTSGSTAPAAAPPTGDRQPVIRAQSQDNHPAYQRR